MTIKDQRALDRQIARFPLVGGIWRRCQKRSLWWVRVPAGILFVFGGCLGFLPILGFWMIPVGLLLMAQDVPVLRRPLRKSLVVVRWRWVRFRRRHVTSARGRDARNGSVGKPFRL
jgi:hypothetical protein